MTRKKNYYRRGMDLFHHETKVKIMFGKWQDDGSAICLTKDKQFITILREDLDAHYTSYSALEKEARQRRRGQAW